MRIAIDLFAIFIVTLIIYLITSLLIRDAKNKKIRQEILSDGVKTDAVITTAYSRSGGNSGFINITLQFDYIAENGDKISGQADTVINSMEMNRYQAGNSIPVCYSRKDPQRVILNIPRVKLSRK